MKLQEQPGASLSPGEEPTARQRVEEQQRYVESLRQEIHSEQRRTERELEREQAHLRQQQSESKYCLIAHIKKQNYFQNAKAKVLYDFKKIEYIGKCWVL